MITKEEVLDIALLSKLYVPEEQLDALTKDMDSILAFADSINAAGAQAEEYVKWYRPIQYRKSFRMSAEERMDIFQSESANRREDHDRYD